MSEEKSRQWFDDRELSLADVRQRGPGLPRIYVISDVRLYREGLISVLQSQLDLVGAGGSGDFLDHILKLCPDVLLLDLAARGSLTIPRRAQQVLPAVRIVAFAVAHVDENVLACAEAGISSYVMQDGSSEDLVAAVLSALRGELVCSPRIAGLLCSRVATLCGKRPIASADAPLTPREREIAALVARNLPNKEIARHLRVGPTTVKNHVHNILQKLNIHRRGDVAGLRLDGNRWRVERAAEIIERR
jgi:two-component system, NarL family, nitrate/nitrite response regulator NarL